MPNIHDGWSTVTCTRVPEYNILLLKWLPNQRTIYSIVSKLDFQFIVIMATYICEFPWKEIYFVCINQMSMYVWCMRSKEFFKHHILIIQIQIEIRKSNEFDVIEWMRCVQKRKYITNKEKSYECKSLFILLKCCTLIRAVLFL